MSEVGASTWVVATTDKRLPAMVNAARALGAPVTVVAVGPRELADAASAAGPDDVVWVAPGATAPVEACAPRVAAAAAAAAPRVLLATVDAGARVLLGAAAVRLGAALVPGVLSLRTEGDGIVVECSAVGGAIVATLVAAGPLAALFAGDDDVPPPETTAPVRRLADDDHPADLHVLGRVAGGRSTGLRDAPRVVGVGRGLKAKADLALVEGVATVLGAEIACSMPVAEDLGWVPKERYVGRSGQHIAPRLYLALGISGTPQHMEGVREAKVVAAVNSDPAAAVFRTADFGIVGDLYEVVPALVAALTS
jgi:electron transfer flavoprotein alpha subunit